jgi:glyoxylase-like metal-dependent hydrolase (beta-lactamase superfamily II)
MVHILDTRQLGRPGIIAATALETADGIALFDTGPESTFDNIAGELRKIGAAPEDVRHVFLSHIHFDHAGSGWRFAELGATVYVHPRGARHLIDPTKLVDSATRIFGDDMPKLWGRVAPVPAERLRVLEDGEVVRVGATDVRAIETPGHASHHHVYHWDDNVFGGDVAGVRIGSGPPIPPFVPPELHVESWLESIDKDPRAAAGENLPPPLRPGGRKRHWSFRPTRGARASLVCVVPRPHAGGEDEPQLIQPFADYEAADLLAGGASEENVRDYETADPSFMAVTAALRYWRKYHPDEAAA